MSRSGRQRKQNRKFVEHGNDADIPFLPMVEVGQSDISKDAVDVKPLEHRCTTGLMVSCSETKVL